MKLTVSPSVLSSAGTGFGFSSSNAYCIILFPGRTWVEIRILATYFYQCSTAVSFYAFFPQFNFGIKRNYMKRFRYNNWIANTFLTERFVQTYKFRAWIIYTSIRQQLLGKWWLFGPASIHHKIRKGCHCTPELNYIFYYEKALFTKGIYKYTHKTFNSIRINQKAQNKHGKIYRFYHTRHSIRRDNYFHLPNIDMLCLYAGFMDRYWRGAGQQGKDMQPTAS